MILCIVTKGRVFNVLENLKIFVVVFLWISEMCPWSGWFVKEVMRMLVVFGTTDSVHPLGALI